MIGKINGGKNFYGLFNYLLKKEQEPKIIFNATLYDQANNIAKEFQRIADKRPSTKKPVKHIVIAFAPQDGEVEQFKKQKIAEKVVQDLGYQYNQWFLVAHGRNTKNHKHSHDHDHIHIAINSITYDGQRVNDWMERVDLGRIMKNLELEYGLEPTHSTPSKRRYPKKVQYQQYQEKFHQWLVNSQQNPNLKPPEEPEIQKLEAIIQASCEGKPTFTEYLARMQHLGYKIKFETTKKGRKRLKYSLQCSEHSIQRITGGSLNQLKKRGVDYDQKRDTSAINLMKGNQKIPISKSRLTKKSDIEKYRFQWLNPKLRKMLKVRQKKQVTISSQLKEDYER